MELNKINTSEINLKVCGQGCTDDCEEKIWAGKTEAEGWQGGCWWKIGYTARGNSLW